jgi:two-component system, cell cycle response regulator
MTLPTPVALLGFSKFERATFDSFFRLASKRQPPYTLVTDLAQAQFVIADADDEEARATLRAQGLLSRTLALGAAPCEGALEQLRRPINLMLVVRALDALPRRAAAMRPGVAQPAPALPATAAPSAQVQRVLESLASRTVTLDGSVDVRALAAQAARPVAPPAPATVPAPVTPPAPADEREGTRLDHILVVDDSDVALRFMAMHLQRFGFQIHLARSGTEALDRIKQRYFEFVFMDVVMDGLDGFQTCKAIKRADYRGGQRPPTVVMLTSRGTPVDKLRGTMAGADAYLTKPLVEAELLKIIGDREVEQHAYADTGLATTMF